MTEDWYDDVMVGRRDGRPIYSREIRAERDALVEALRMIKRKLVLGRATAAATKSYMVRVEDFGKVVDEVEGLAESAVCPCPGPKANG